MAYYYKMSADPITYCLERISDYRDFERLCSALLAGVSYPGIDPLGGTGDEGRDAIIRSDGAERKISFAYTVRSDWKVKLASDSKRVQEKGHSPDVFVFVCTEVLSASDKDYAQKFISGTYGWVLDLFDLERLRVHLVGDQRHLIAQHPSIFAPPFFPKKGGQSIAESRDMVFEGKEIGRRRKIVTKSWWNKEWLARLLGVVQALQTSDGCIELGEGKRSVVMQTKPLSWECPVGLDILALSGLSDIGEEIAQYRSRDSEDDEDEMSAGSEGGAAA